MGRGASSNPVFYAVDEVDQAHILRMALRRGLRIWFDAFELKGQFIHIRIRRVEDATS